MEKIIEFIHNRIKEKVTNNDITVDMTVGNGNDTLFLVQLSKYVYGFDIQEMAINNTNNLLVSNNYSNYSLFLDSHENILSHVNNKVKAFIYNLGYLPKGNKDITTSYESTIRSLEASLSILDDDGLICFAVYEGHENGKIESNKLIEYVNKLDQKLYNVVIYRFINQINNPPYALIIEKR